MNAIVYCSNTGFAARYAQALGRLSGLAAYPVERAMKELPTDTKIFYLTWVKAGSLVKCGAVSGRFLICGIGAVALNTGAGQDHALRVRSGLPSDFPLFMLPGGYDASRLNWLDSLMMKLVLGKLNRELSGDPRPSDHKLAMRDLLTNGGDLYDEEELQPILAWMQVYKKTRE